MISVIIPNYNHGKFLEQSTISVLNQSNSDFEIIIVNDGSTDDSLDVILSLQRQDKRVKLINLENNCGMINAINIGIKASIGKYFFGLAADDFLISKNFFSDAVQALSISECTGFFGKTEIVDQSFSKRIGFLGSSKRDGLINKKDVLKDFLLSKIFIPGSSSIWKKEEILKIGLFDETLGPQADYFVNHFIAILGGVVFHDNVYTCMRSFENSYGNSIDPIQYLNNHSKIIDRILAENIVDCDYLVKNWKLRVIENVFPEKRVAKYLGNVKKINERAHIYKLPKELRFIISQLNDYDVQFKENLNVAKKIMKIF